MDQLISQTKAIRSFQSTQIASFHRTALNLLEKNANSDGGKIRIGSNYARFNLFPSRCENLSHSPKGIIVVLERAHEVPSILL